MKYSLSTFVAVAVFTISGHGLAQEALYAASSKAQGAPFDLQITETKREESKSFLTVPGFHTRTAPASRWLMCAFVDLAIQRDFTYWTVVYPAAGNDIVVVALARAATVSPQELLGLDYAAERILSNEMVPVEKFAALCGPQKSRSADAAMSESRDAVTAYLGTANFVVGRVGRDCLALVGRSDTPQAFVSAWQRRNFKYLMASNAYMEARLREAEAAGGVEARTAVMGALTKAVRSGAETTVKSWIDRPERSEACKRAIVLIESGAYDISPNSPMYQELENLVLWARLKG